MKKKSKTTTVYRIDQEKGNYTTISRNILISKELTDSAKTLLQLCLNNASEWKLVLSHYKKILNWSNDKMSNAVSNLIEYGYLKKEKLPNGKSKGFTYLYIVSEFGNLNPNREKASKEEIIQNIELTELQNDKNNHQLEVIEKEDSIDELNIKTSAITNLERNAINEILLELVKSTNISDDYLIKLSEYYLDKFSTGKLTISKLNKENEILLIKAKMKNNFISKMKIIEEWVDYYNNRGTKAQRDNVKQRALRYYSELSSVDEVVEKEVSNRMLKIKCSIVDANRVHDSRYQD